MSITVKIVNNSTNDLPYYATTNSAGMDLKANIVRNEDNEVKLKGENFEVKITEDGLNYVILHPLGRVLIPTGIHISLPVGYEAQIRPRSGLALKHGITIVNSPGTIDSDYRGDVGIILANLGSKPFTIMHGDRIAQMVISKHEEVVFEEVTDLDDTERGHGGFGHTNK